MLIGAEAEVAVTSPKMMLFPAVKDSVREAPLKLEIETLGLTVMSPLPEVIPAVVIVTLVVPSALLIAPSRMVAGPVVGANTPPP